MVKRMPPSQRTHGMSKTPTYASWVAMRERCTKPSVINFHLYGGRGIKVCDRWLHSFENFLEDMGVRPKGTTLDRWPNKDGDYEPGNCRWATAKEQGRNTRTNVKFEYAGQMRTVSEIAAMTGIKDGTLRKRLFTIGLSIEEAVSAPLCAGKGRAHHIARAIEKKEARA